MTEPPDRAVEIAAATHPDLDLDLTEGASVGAAVEGLKKHFGG